MSHRLKIAAFVAFLSIAVTARSEDCPSAAYDPEKGLVLRSQVNQQSTFNLISPMASHVKARTGKDGVTDVKVKPESVQVCVMTRQQRSEEKTCTSPDVLAGRSTPTPFSLGYCAVEEGKPKTSFPVLGIPKEGLATAQSIVIRYLPAGPGSEKSVLRFEWQEDVTTAGATTADPKVYFANFDLTGEAGVPRYDEDSRYKLWLYTGYTWFQSRNDFRDGYPELRARVESRLIDSAMAMQKRDPARYRQILDTGKRCSDLETRRLDTDADGKVSNPEWTKGKGSVRDFNERDTNQDSNLSGTELFTCSSASFGIIRLYGDLGLTGTNTVRTDSGNAESTDKTRHSFDGSLGMGFGVIRPVAPRQPSDTDAFSIQGIVHLGIISIPGEDSGKPGAIAYSYSVGPRVENESGHFQGAYFELGWGQSERFTLKKVPRLSADALLPINDPGGLFRLAARLQMDTPRPFAKAKGEGENKGSNLAGEIRISILFNIDLMELSHRLGVTPPSTR